MNSSKRYFITGIDTDSGKTIASAALVEKLQADYWKPVQAGFPTDSNTVKSLVSKERVIHPEGKILQAPMSPHAAAKLENIEVQLSDFRLPKTQNTLIIEGAGGVMVPLNDKELIIEMAKIFDAKVILVSRNYLGSINHTLLSISYLKNQGFNIAGILFNDSPNPETESFILKYTGMACLGHLGQLNDVNPMTVQKASNNIKLL